MSRASLIELLLGEAGGTEPEPEPEPEPELEARLVSILEGARQAWPGLGLDDEVFVRYLGQRLARHCSPLEALSQVNATDLYLACACVEGLPGSHRRFIRAHVVGIEAVGRDLGAVEPAELRQWVCEHVLVAQPPQPPRIASFSGRGELGHWVRITARRLLIDRRRKRSPHTTDIEHVPASALVVDGDDPELGLLAETYRESFRAALEDAFGRLSPRERTLLRYRFVDGLEVNQIASVCGRHRVSVSRSLGNARQRLLGHVRRHLVTSLRLRRSEADSLMRLMRSQIQLSVSRLLRRAEP